MQIKIYRANKETALELVSYFFSNIVHDETINPLTGEFECFELMAKAQSMLYVCRNKSLNKNQKRDLIKYIKEL
jgi:hypothetical protein